VGRKYWVGVMAMSPEEALSDLQIGIVHALAAICNQLIERDRLSAELLIADLQSAVGEIQKGGLSEIAQAVPFGLSLTLAEKWPVPRAPTSPGKDP
jgi:hypothetical protein